MTTLQLPLVESPPGPPKPKPIKPAIEFRIQRLRECAVDYLGDSPERIYRFWTEYVPNAPWYMEDREIAVVFNLNTRRRITGFSLLGIGSLDTILVHPRDVFRGAIMAGAATIVMAHCHPSGDPCPSEGDIKVTRDLIRAGQLLRIDLLDHVVIGKPSPKRTQPYVSLRELGYFF
jgi:DNA repair protein RadC